MSINLRVSERHELKPRITVFGVGGAGSNAVNNMIETGLQGVEFVVANTDAQALSLSRAQRRIQMGEGATQGLGAGSHPEVGCAAAEEAIDEIMDHLSGCHMVFVTAGMGGGTGTGAAPVIARVAKQMGILTVAVVTKPFQFEGGRRMRIAQEGLAELEKHVDTLLVIPNQNLFRVANEKTTFAEAFAMADQVLFSGVSGITDLMMAPGLINLDFADVRSIMGGAGTAMMGTGESAGENRAIEAAEAAISNPLLEDVSMAGARGVLINITGGPDLTLYEVDEAANRVRAEVDTEANIIFGSTFDSNLEGRMRVSVVAAGVRPQKPVLHVVPRQIALEVVQPVQTVMEGLEEAARATVDAPAPAVESYLSCSEPEILLEASEEADSPAAAPDAGGFIPGPAVHPLAQAPLIAAIDPVAVTADPSRQGAQARQGGNLMARLGWFTRSQRNRPGDTATRQDKRITPTLRAAVASGADADMPDRSAVPGVISEEDQLEIPAFLRRTAN